MKISVALCTYNGSKYIEEQLRSILNQTMRVDEIVICDDGSTDDTIQIIEKVKKEALADIRIYRNETNLGVCANFQKAVDLCQGDIVFLSDQDDVWYPHKVKTVSGWFDANPDKSVVFTNADLIDETGKYYTMDTLFDRVGFERDMREYFDSGCELPVFYYCNHATGATMAIHERFEFANSCSKDCLHDEVIALMAIQRHRLGYLSESLIKYRTHDMQNNGIFSSKLMARFCFNEKHLLDPEISNGRLERWKFQFTEETKEYQVFLRWRSLQKYSFFGFVNAFRHAFDYKKVYKKKWFSFCQYDYKNSLKHSLYRIKNKLGR